MIFIRYGSLIVRLVVSLVCLYFVWTFITGLTHGFTSNYEATITNLSGTTAAVEWTQNQVQFGGEGKNVTMTATVDISNLSDFSLARVGDTIDINVSTPGFVEKIASISGSQPVTKVEAVDLNLNWFTEAWRYITT